MEKVRSRCGQPSDRGRLKNRTDEEEMGDEHHTCTFLTGVIGTLYLLPVSRAGVQRRDIHCRPRCGNGGRRRHRRTGNGPGMPCAMFTSPPEAERACAVECRRDCVTT